ncbi:polysaccharide deacetylase family protein [Streptomyces sp. NPDC060198]|uniref:polysaccharide deacetylase family protein n=1 Tax=Streptomyces sp. NPDC060198 TaxID=3347070 RepID=UPI003655CA10
MRRGVPGPAAVVRAVVVRAVLGLLALTLVALPFYAAWRYDAHRRAVTPQAAPPAGARPVTGEAAPPRGGPGADAAAPPVVLAYHDIGPRGRSRYTVTPEAFDAQLAALARAGYRSLSTEEFVRYLDGGPPPARRSVFLTFDDGTHGLWVYGDRILARYRMRATAFLITGSVGSHRPYYLSWQEIGRMAATGRWDFQDHTHALHRRGAVDAAGTQVSALSHRLWLPGARRLEREDEYRARISDDFDTSLAELSRHGLPRPRLFAYPFSEVSEPADSASSSAILRHELAARFAAALTNTSRRPLPAGRRAAAAREVQRLEITRATDLPAFRAELDRWTAVTPDSVPRPLEDRAGWERIGTAARAGPGAFTGEGPYPGGKGYAASSYRPLATADWTDYTVEATVERLSEARNDVGIVVRDRSLTPVTVSLSHSYVSLFTGSGARRTEVARRTLRDGAVHRVRVTVRGAHTEVVVDGRFRIDWTDEKAAGAAGRGGIGLVARNGDAQGEWPRFASLRVSSVRIASPPGARAGTGTARTAPAEGR